MTLLETRIARLWLDGKNTDEIAKIVGLKEYQVTNAWRLAQTFKAVAREAAR